MNNYYDQFDDLKEAYDELDEEETHDKEEEQEMRNQGCCSGCMDCLGMTWKDFY